MKIVALFARGEIGKSTTLKIFLQQLLEKNSITAKNCKGNEIITSDRLKDELKKENARLLSISDVNNYTVTFEIGKVKYGLTTRGDNYEALEEDFKYFDDCGIVFCATRTKGGSVEFVESKSKDLIWVAKTYVSGKFSDPEKKLKLMNYTNEKQVEILMEIYNNI